MRNKSFNVMLNIFGYLHGTGKIINKKKNLVFCIIFVIGLLNISNVYGGGYFLLTAGGGGEANAVNIGGEAGYMWRIFLLGMGISVTLPDSDWEKIDSDYDEDFEYVDDSGRYEKKEDELELYIAGGVRVLKDFFVVATAGYSIQAIAKKNCVPGLCIEWSPEFEKEYFTYSGQLRYVYKRLIIGGGYHNRRGIVGRIGITF